MTDDIDDDKPDLRLCWEAEPELWAQFCWATDRPEDSRSDVWTVDDVNNYFYQKIREMIDIVDALIERRFAGKLN